MCVAQEAEISFFPPVNIGRHDAPFLQNVAAGMAEGIVDENNRRNSSRLAPRQCCKEKSVSKLRFQFLIIALYDC